MLLLLQFIIVFGSILIGVRYGGVGLGFWGGLGLFVLVVCFGVVPTSPPVDVLLIILAVCLCASCMEVLGGIDVLIRIAARIIRSNPKRVAVLAPTTAFFLTFFVGTANAIYALYPIVYEVSYNANVRPERAMAPTAIAAQIGITASPIAAATAAMIGLLASNGHSELGLGSILMVTFPACLIGVVVGSFLCMRRGKELKDDPEYQARLKAGLVEPPAPIDDRPLPKQAYMSVLIFLGAILVVVVTGFFPTLRILPGQTKAIGMPLVIECVMLAAGAVMCLCCKLNIHKVVKSPVMNAAVVAVAAIYGISWMSDSFISMHSKFFAEVAGHIAQTVPIMFALVLAVMAALLNSQGATTRAIMPLGFALGIPPMLLIAMFPAVNCLFIMPTTGSALAGVSMDRSGTTKIGKYVLNHSYLLPGLVITSLSILVAYGIVTMIGY